MIYNIIYIIYIYIYNIKIILNYLFSKKILKYINLNVYRHFNT